MLQAARHKNCSMLIPIFSTTKSGMQQSNMFSWYHLHGPGGREEQKWKYDSAVRKIKL